jgi:hypothetical protein
MHLFGRSAGGHVKVFGRLAQDQVAHAAADNKRLVTGVLQFFDSFRGVRAKLFEPNAMLGLGYGDEVFNVYFAL